MCLESPPFTSTYCLVYAHFTEEETEKHPPKGCIPGM